MRIGEKDFFHDNAQLQMADLLMDVIPKIMQVLRTEMRHGRGDRLTVPQFRVLAHINSGVTQNNELADKLGVSAAAISRMVDILEFEKLIIKGIDENDRRHAKLSLTSEGKKLFNHIKKDAKKRLEKKINLINSHDLKVITAGLESLQKYMPELQTMSEKE